MFSGNLLYAVIGCLIYAAAGQTSESVDANSELEISANSLLSSLFGTENQEQCEGEDCENVRQDNQWESINFIDQSTGYEGSHEYSYVDASAQKEATGYEEADQSGYVDFSNPEENSEINIEVTHHTFCEEFTSVVKEVEHINPEFKTVKHEVLQKFKKYSKDFATELKKCYSGPAAIQLLDLIILVAQKIKSDYAHLVDIPYPEQIPEEHHPEPVPHEPFPQPVADDYEHVEEIMAEEESYNVLTPGYVGSHRGIPGLHYPNYAEVPITSFSCADKSFIPGFYADLETGCQVFHVCYEHRRESFLCPVGTTFNQPILACDYWYSTNCSKSPLYYEVNKHSEVSEQNEEVESTIEALINTIIDGEKPDVQEEVVIEDVKYEKHDISDIVQFLPVKAEVFEFTKPIHKPPVKDVEETASKIFDTSISAATKVVSMARDVIEKIPEPEISVPVKTVEVAPIKVDLPLEAKLVSVPVVKAAVPLSVKAKFAAKAKLAAAALPAAKIVAAKAILPAIAKAKLAASAVPIAKAAAIKSAIPIVTKAKLAVAVPVVKAAVVKSALPVKAKAKLAAAAVPIAKAAAVKSAIPVVAKAKLAAAAIPIAKVAAVKTAVPIAAKAKLAAAVPVAKVAVKKAVVPIAVKAKLAAAVPVVKAKMAVPVAKVLAAKTFKAKAIPIVKAKAFSVPVAKAAFAKAAAVPFVKGKMAALPLAKAKLAAASIPVVKAKIAAKALPLAKFAAVKTIPAIKGKIATMAMLSPLTKKALALGYMKLLKAKKLALMG